MVRKFGAKADRQWLYTEFKSFLQLNVQQTKFQKEIASSPKLWGMFVQRLVTQDKKLFPTGWTRKVTKLTKNFQKSLCWKDYNQFLNNHFFFDDKNYNKGTAIGSKVAPTYATLVLRFLEEKVYAETHELFEMNLQIT